jgi:RNA polymerase sigma factor (TIGR02999 family)
VSEAQHVTRLLAELTAGRRDALDELVPMVYGDLRQIARAHLRGERTGHTLNTTGLVHEAYIRLARLERIEWQDRRHFFAVASRAMRRVLIDWAKARRRDKRGGGAVQVPLDEAMHLTEQQADELIALDSALTRLEAVSERQSRLVECRFFGGLTMEESADVLGISLATAKRDWALCRAWLNRELEGGDTGFATA